MPKSPDTSTVIVAKGQYKITVPRPIAELLGLKKGQKLKWRPLGKDRLELIMPKQ